MSAGRAPRGGVRAARSSLSLALLLGACGGSGEAEPSPAGVPVETAVAVRGDFAEVLEALATVSARPGGSASLAAPGPTRVLAVRVAEGDRVARGQALVELDQAVWTAELTGARASLAAAADAQARAARLVEGGILPRKDLEAADAELARARADAAAAAKTASLGVLRSPIDGIVTRVRAPVGSSVDAANPLVEVVDPTALEAVLSLSPDDAARVTPGNPVTLLRQSESGPLPVAEGVVARVALALDDAGARTARAPFSSLSGSVAVGESLAARVIVAVHVGALTVPSEALVPDEAGGFLVYVVGADDVAHRRPVVVGARADGRALLLSGLEEGERVVVGGSFQVAEGATVVPG